MTAFPKKTTGKELAYNALKQIGRPVTTAELSVEVPELKNLNSILTHFKGMELIQKPPLKNQSRPGRGSPVLWTI